MIRSGLIAVFVFFSIVHLAGQEVDFLFSGGMGFYSMEDLKKINTEVQQQQPFETRIITDFPPWFNFGGQVTVRAFPIYRIGVKYVFSSTGSRISSADYSGEYYFDDVVNGHTLGLINSFRIFRYKDLELDIQINLGAIFSSIKTEESITVYDTTLTGKSRFNSTGFFAEPLLQGTYQWKVLKMGIFLGYLHNQGGRIKTQDGGKTSTYTNWSGFRFGVVFGFNIGKLPEKTPDISK
jgi:hypothetical protein